MLEEAKIDLLAKQYKIKLTKGDAEANYQIMVQKLGGEDKVAAQIKEVWGVGIPEFKRIILERLIREEVQKRVTEEFLTQVHVRHILIVDEKKANEVLALAKKGEDFAGLANKYSEDVGSKDKGGDIGWIARGTQVTDFENTAFLLKAGEVAQNLVKTEFGFHIIKVEERKDKTDKKFDDWIVDQVAKSRVWRMIK
jgi:parvulin-like peptidyl-prolyl isomerase